MTTNALNVLEHDLQGDFMTVTPRMSFIFGEGYLLPAHVTKQPVEKRLLEFECSGALCSGDSISSVVATAYDEDGVASPTILSGSPTINATDFSLWIQAGTNRKNYWVDLKVTTALGEVLNNDLRIVVREKGF